MEATGEVIDYTFFSNNGLRPPIVKFTVNGKMYTAKLTHTAFSFFSSSFVKRTEVKGDKLDTVFRMKRNKHISTNPMVELFPLGSKLRVIYNPSKPEQNYVERWAPNMLDIIFMSCGVTILIGLPVADSTRLKCRELLTQRGVFRLQCSNALLQRCDGGLRLCLRDAPLIWRKGRHGVVCYSLAGSALGVSHPLGRLL